MWASAVHHVVLLWLLCLSTGRGFSSSSRSRAFLSHLSKARVGDARVGDSSLTMSVTKGAIVGGGRIGNLLFELNGKQDRLLSNKEST